MKLYYSPGACSMASHIVLHEIGKPFEIEKVDGATKKTERGEDFKSINSKGAVPALEISKGEVLTEGAAILQYIADTNGALELAPRTGTLERARVQEMLNFTSSELHKAFGPLFNDKATDAEKSAALKLIGNKFDWLESRLSDGRHFLTGKHFTVADAYAFVISNWANFKAISLAPWPYLKAFVERVGARPSVHSAMKAEGLI